MPNSKARFIILKIVIAVMFAAVIWKLFDLQVLKGEQYYEIANDRMTTNIVEKAPRGEILDRYGTTLVSNKVGYSVVMQKTDVKDEEFNDIIKKLVDIFYSTQCEYYDDLPISFAPYQFKFEDENEDGSVEDEREAWFKNNSHLGKGIEENMSADQIMQAYKEIYKVSDVYSEDEQRRIVGIRYAAEASGLSQTTLFTVADDISVDAVTQIKERQDEFKGIAVINREYLTKTVDDILNGIQGAPLAEADVAGLYDKLYPYTQVGDDVKRQHIDDIQKMLEPTADDEKTEAVTTASAAEESEHIPAESAEPMPPAGGDATETDSVAASEKAPTLICPECGGTLVVRTARRGANAGERFYGCSNYPKCRYIKKI